jgi:hypothetical protein
MDDAASTFTFEATLDYSDWRGRERECEARVAYTFDGRSAPKCTSAIALSDDEEAEYELDRIVDDWIADRCQGDFDEAFPELERAA